MLSRGDRIGEYILLNKVGSGGFGDVWKAEKRTALDVNYFALKFFRPKDDQINFENIRKELSVWKQLRGLGNIISVIELDRFEDYVYVVSDFADGGSLENWLRENKKAQSEAQAIEITSQILQGLENLHEKGFVHRDLKPDNLLIMNGKLCLADFGISREVKTHSKATGTAGTVEYMPPEAFEKNPPVSPQTDIWAVGVILQKLLTGELPFPHEMPALMLAILQDEPEPMPVGISEGLREIVKKALQKKRENRFQSAREMREALQNPIKFLASLPRKQAETIVDEDFNKTEVLKIEPAETQPAVEPQKAETQKENANIPTVEAQRQQAELSNIQRGLLDRSKKKVEEKDNGFVGILAASIFIILGVFIFAIVYNRSKPITPIVNRPASNNTTIRPSSPISNPNSNKVSSSEREASNIASNLFNTGTNNSNNPKYYLDNADDCYDRKDYDCAIQNYTKYLELKPNDANAYNNRGISHYLKNNYEKAIRDYSKAIELDSDNEIYYNNRGISYYQQRDYDSAIADQRKALQINPNYQKAKDNLAEALKQKNGK